MPEPSRADAAQQNRLLAALPENESKRLAPHLEMVSLQLSEILFRPEDPVRYVYFPTTAIISLLTDLSDGSGIEVGLVGKEGVADVSVILNAESESKLATVQGAGSALRTKARALKDQFARGGKLQGYLLRYTNALMSQISQTAVCNLRHKIDCKLARWLLMYQDRAGSDEFFLTQDFIANMLGIRRAGVSVVAHRLRQAGLIRYKRGQITILNRQRLQDVTCECYPILKAEFDSLYSN